MKKKQILFCLTLLLLVTVTGCGKKETYAEKKEKEQVESSKGYIEKETVLRHDNDWYYIFTIGIPQTGARNYYFTGCNLKYDRLPDYNVLVIDDATNTVTERIPTYPTIGTSDKKKNNVTEREEVDKINTYFVEKQFDKEITEKTLHDLKLENFDKKELVKLYNQTWNSPKREIGKFNLNPCQIEKSNTENKIQFQVGTMTSKGNLAAARIDAIYPDGNYLSDLITSGKATDEQKAMYESFAEIEKYMIENQTMDIASQFSTYQSTEYKNLFALLKKVGDHRWEN